MKTKTHLKTRVNEHFYEENIDMATKRMKNCVTLTVLEKTYIKTRIK
jgi:hypothetical protein